MPGGHGSSSRHHKLTREEELLLQDFSRNVSTKSSALFYGNAMIISVIPICKKKKTLFLSLLLAMPRHLKMNNKIKAILDKNQIF